MQMIVLDPGKLRDARQAAGLTQRQAAERAGIVRATLQNAESGKFAPRVEALARLAAVYGVSIDSLFTHEGDGNRSPERTPETNPAPTTRHAKSAVGA